MPFHGEEGENVERFIVEARRCLAHNRLPAADQVGQISYFLEDSAREVYDTEVNDIVQALMDAGKENLIGSEEVVKKVEEKAEDYEEEEKRLIRRAAQLNERLLHCAQAEGKQQAQVEDLDQVLQDLDREISELKVSKGDVESSTAYFMCLNDILTAKGTNEALMYAYSANSAIVFHLGLGVISYSHQKITAVATGILSSA